jgi:hypothetical protein
VEAVRRRSALQKALVGPAGEHFVLFRLYKHGMLASLSPPGSPTVDVLVLAHDESVIATLQVKTRTGAHMGWQMSEKHEDISAPRYYYAFVDLDVPEGHLPVTYIIPSKVVADVVKQSHQIWIEIPGRGGRPHRRNPVRQVLPAYGLHMPDEYQPGWMDKYRERWDLLQAAGV